MLQLKEKQIIKQTSLNATTLCEKRDIKFIVIHYTAGTTAKKGTARNTASYFSKAKASADFIVDDKEIVQYNPDLNNRYCWAVGGNPYNTEGGSLYGYAINKNTINIEICSSNSAGKMDAANAPTYFFTEKAVKNALKLTKYLMLKYDIKLIHVVRHYDVTGKLCPGIIGWNKESGSEKAWEKFKKKLM